MTTIQHNDIGTVIVIVMTDEDDVAIDISSATTKQVWIERSDQSVVKQTAAFVSDGSDGQLTYTVVADDLTPAGRAKVQGYVVMPSGTWHSKPSHVHINRNAGE